MTQFLLVRSSTRPHISGFAVEPVTEDDFLRPIAERVLGGADRAWVIRPDAEEMDDVVDASVMAMDGGAAFRETSLARALATIVGSCDGLALFWSSFPDDLPAADSLAHLHEMIEAQLREKRASGEVYGQWNRSTARGSSFERGV